MPNNATVTDIRPKNIGVITSKSRNTTVLDIQPNNLNLGKEPNRLYSVTIGANQAMGLLLALTYTTGFTVITPVSP